MSNLKIKDIKIAIVGLGYVGLPLAIEFSKKRNVLAYDKNPQRIKELKQRQLQKELEKRNFFRIFTSVNN